MPNHPAATIHSRCTSSLFGCTFLSSALKIIFEHRVATCVCLRAKSPYKARRSSFVFVGCWAYHHQLNVQSRLEPSRFNDAIATIEREYTSCSYTLAQIPIAINTDCRRRHQQFLGGRRRTYQPMARRRDLVDRRFAFILAST